MLAIGVLSPLSEPTMFWALFFNRLGDLSPSQVGEDPCGLAGVIYFKKYIFIEPSHLQKATNLQSCHLSLFSLTSFIYDDEDVNLTMLK
jgi:hypothetical protein